MGLRAGLRLAAGTLGLTLVLASCGFGDRFLTITSPYAGQTNPTQISFIISGTTHCDYEIDGGVVGSVDAYPSQTFSEPIPSLPFGQHTANVTCDGWTPSGGIPFNVTLAASSVEPAPGAAPAPR